MEGRLEKDNILYVVGIGPGNPEYIYPAARKVIEGCDLLIGGRRNLNLFRGLQKEEKEIGGNLEEVRQFIAGNAGSKTMVVLASGDTGLFSIAGYLKKQLAGLRLEIFPGISSLQYLCARIGESWEDCHIVSLHGRRTENICDAARRYGKVAVFTGGGSSPAVVCRELLAGGLRHVRVVVGEKLSYEEERIMEGTPKEIDGMEFDSLSILLLKRTGLPEKAARVWEYETGGIPDELFLRGEVPMTKEEVRAAALSKLRLKEDSVLFDIGAGTGSVAIECGLLMKQGHVYAIEKEKDALELIRRNIEKFGVGNVKVVEGTAPGSLKGLPVPDRVFIGGSGGRMEEILDFIAATGGRRLRVVANLIVLENACELIKGLEKRGFCNMDIACIAISRGRQAGEGHMLQALNPVYIISAELSGEGNE